MPYHSFLVPLFPHKNYGMICSPTGRSLSPVIEGPDLRGGATAPHRNRNCPWTLGPARRFPELRSQAGRPVQAAVFGSLVCPGGGQGGLGAGNLSRFSSEPSCGHGSALSHWMGRLSRQNFWGIQYSSLASGAPYPSHQLALKGAFGLVALT